MSYKMKNINLKLEKKKVVMKFMIILFSTIFIVACNSKIKNENKLIENKHEENSSRESKDSSFIDEKKTETDSISEELLTDFFTVADSFLTEKNWYYEDKSGIETLLLERFEEEDYGWRHLPESNEKDFIAITTFFSNTHIELSFKVFNRNGKKHAFLAESDKNESTFFLLQYSITTGVWLNKSEFIPTLFNTDFFSDLNKEEMTLVEGNCEYKVNQSYDRIVFYFDDFLFSNCIDEKFSKESDFEFVLQWNNDGFWLEKQKK